MTDIQKRKIIQFRKEGVGYMKIGQFVGLSTSTVRYFWQMSEGEIGEKEYCRQCGKKLVQREKVKTRLFCCDECRHKWKKTITLIQFAQSGKLAIKYVNGVEATQIFSIVL